MKKLFVTFALAISFIFFQVNHVIAADYFSFYNEVVKIKEEYFSLEEKHDLKSFGFLVNILTSQIMEYEIKMEYTRVETTKYSQEKQMAKLTNRYYAIFQVQLFTLDKYLEYEVIAKSSNAKKMQKKCKKLIEYIRKAEEALR